MKEDRKKEREGGGRWCFRVLKYCKRSDGKERQRGSLNNRSVGTPDAVDKGLVA